MARKKISEFRAKTIISEELGIHYNGASITPATDIDQEIEKLDSEKFYVVKVDQGIKKRGKQGLVKVKVLREQIKNEIQALKKLGFHYFIIEEFIPHESSDERYLALSRTREGVRVFYSDKGGVDIEENKDSIKSEIIPSSRPEPASSADRLDSGSTYLQEIPDQVRNDIFKLIRIFEKYYFSFLELNPFMILDSSFLILDAAVEVDSTAEFFVDASWTPSDFRDFSNVEKTQEEKAVEDLSEKSQAAFSLTVLNPNASVFMLLSGGGASIVLADEAHNQGLGKEVGNYGEYSGNPNAEETYIYTKQILSLMKKSDSKNKVLLIGGGVANFTDIRSTFKGVIRAIQEDAEELRNNGIKIFVRRGGPNQKEGLQMMKDFLEKEQLYGEVQGPDMMLTQIIDEALEQVTQNN